MKRYIIKQADATDCGASCLLSIIKYYEGYVPLEVIKVDTYTNDCGTNFYYLKMAAEKYGFNSIGKKVTKLNNIKLPCIAQLNVDGFNHFVVIYKVEKEVTYMDPSKGIITVSQNDFKKMFTGSVLELIPAGKIIKYETNNLFKDLIINLYKKHLKVIIVLLLLSFIVVILSLIAGLKPLLLKKKNLLPFIILVGIIKILITYIKNNIMSRLNKYINISLLKDYLYQIIDLPLKYLQLKKTGDFINRINDLENIKSLFSKAIFDFLINTLFLIFSLIFIFILEFKLSLILLIITILYSLILFKINKKIYFKIISSIESENNLTDKIIEFLNIIKIIKTNDINYFKNNLEKNINDSGNKKLLLDKLINVFELISNSLEEVMMIIIFVYYYHYGFDISIILIYITIYSYYLETIKYYINLLPLMMYFKDVIYRIKSIYDIDIQKSKYNISLNKNIYLKNINYSFNNIKPIFNNLNIKIKYGNKVLIKGGNGSGKTTLLDIIYGIITDYEGRVVKGSNINYLPQNSKLFSGTILENIILNNKYDSKKLKEISKILLLDNIISEKSNGYYSKVSSLTNLSGGECQRILLARSLYSNFDILLLDESLNEISQSDREIILKNIFEYYKEKTIICVSHYDSNIKYDQIINLTARKEKIC